MLWNWYCSKGIPAFLPCLMALALHGESAKLPACVTDKRHRPSLKQLRFSATLQILYLADFKVLQSGMSGLFLTLQKPYLIQIQASSQSCWVQWQSFRRWLWHNSSPAEVAECHQNSNTWKHPVISEKPPYQISDRIKIENGAAKPRNCTSGMPWHLLPLAVRSLRYCLILIFVSAIEFS